MPLPVHYSKMSNVVNKVGTVARILCTVAKWQSKPFTREH